MHFEPWMRCLRRDLFQTSINGFNRKRVNFAACIYTSRVKYSLVNARRLVRAVLNDGRKAGLGFRHWQKKN